MPGYFQPGNSPGSNRVRRGHFPNMVFGTDKDRYDDEDIDYYCNYNRSDWYGCYSVPTTAQANGFGAGLATGVIGGAIVGGAIANSQRHDGQGYSDGPVYEDGGYAHCRRVLFHDDYGHETWRRVCN